MIKDFSKYKVAIVTDWMVKPGGADRLLLSLLKVFTNADVKTSIYNEKVYTDRFKLNNNVFETFLGKSRFFRKHYRHINFLTPIAFEHIDLSPYDFVISLSAGASKGVIPKPGQNHIGIILTPPRNLWDKESNIRALKLKSFYKIITPIINTYLRIWDQTAIDRVDYLISISKFIQNKVQKTYRRESEVIYPGLDDYWFEKPLSENILDDAKSIKEDFFLVVSRLYDYKKIDLAIQSIKQTNKKLVIVGEGPDSSYLKKIANNKTIFLGWQNDDTVKYLYSKALALIFCGVEDFGYTPIEAMASGCPVLAYNKGGVTETVKNNISGRFFENQEELSNLMKSFRKKDFKKDKIILNAKEFSEEKFVKDLTQFISKKIEI